MFKYVSQPVQDDKKSAQVASYGFRMRALRTADPCERT